jgi:putative Mg2+ transporter-C (MgtC) family protein
MIIPAPDDWMSMLLRLGVATVSGAILGVNRSLHNKPAGLRVLSMVALGACSITLGTIMALGAESPSDAKSAMFRTVQGILSGMGFLGAGVILRGRDNDSVQGLATAAAIWIACILGVLAGLGEWLLGGLTFGVTIAMLTVGHPLEKFLEKFGRELKQERNAKNGNAEPGSNSG